MPHHIVSFVCYESHCAELLSRQGSTAELRLLAAEFSYLDTQLAALAAQLGLEELPATSEDTQPASTGQQGISGTPAPAPKEPATATAAASAATAAGRASGMPPVRNGGRGVVLMGGGTLDQVLATLAVEIPDLRQRVGVP